MTDKSSLEALAERERRIIAAGHKLAAQLGAVFQVVPSKLSDFRARATQEAPHD